MSGTTEEPATATETTEAAESISRADDTILKGKEKARESLAASGINLEQNGEVSHGPSRQQTQSPSRKRKRDTPLDRLQADEYVNREYLHKALLADQLAHPSVLQEKKHELQFYQTLRQRREHDPASVFGVGYEGFGNPRTDEKLQNPIVYPRLRRAGKRKTVPPRVTRTELAAQSEQSEELVPIRLDVEWNKIKLRDTFTWNLHDRTTSVDYFAEKLVEDFGLEVKTCAPLVQSVKMAIKEQIADYGPQIYTVEDDALDLHLPYSAYKNDEMRILVKLNITIGQNTLIDQFEWDINNPGNSPEEFAQQMTLELSLAGEFTTAIAHSIREQCQLFSKSLHITGYAFDGRPVNDPDLQDNFLLSPLPTTFRPYQSAKDYTPYLYELNEADLERTELSISREQRRQKRSTNRRGGPALPDLKDRQRTIRSLVVSSVIPGGALTMEDSRIFRIAKASRRSGRRTGADEFEDSDASESEDSSPDSPAIPAQYLSQQGTARTRGLMRNAALTATASIRSNLNGFMSVRSTTPEAGTPHHDARAAARRRDYKEDSDDDSLPEKLIVKLKIPRDKLRRKLRELRAQDRSTLVSISGSPLPGAQIKAPPAASPLKLAGGPPPASTINADPFLGAVDAPAEPPSANNPAPPPPDWLLRSLEGLRKTYPNDRIEAVMKHGKIDMKTQSMVPDNEENKHLPYKFVPRVRCLDCIGRVYMAGPGPTADNFVSHLKNKKHQETVKIRMEKTVGS